MKKGLINLVFCIDESGSMSSSVGDVIGGFKRVVDEQKAVDDGECVISLYKFSSTVSEEYVGKKLDEIGELDYKPGGLTKLFDGIGVAIDNVGKWLDSMDEDEKPEKTLFVITTDGEENSSMEYSAEKVKNMIKHQTEKYGWEFVYLGSDLTNSKDASTLGFKNAAYTTKAKLGNTYNLVSNVTSGWRKKAVYSTSEANTDLNEVLTSSLRSMNTEYLADTGIDLTSINNA